MRAFYKYQFPAACSEAKVTVDRTERIYIALNRGCATFPIFRKFFNRALRFHFARTPLRALVRVRRRYSIYERVVTAGRGDRICF